MPVGSNSITSQFERYTRFQEALDWVADMIGELATVADGALQGDLESAELQVSALATDIEVASSDAWQKANQGSDLHISDTLADWSDISDWLRGMDSTEASPINAFERSSAMKSNPGLVKKAFEAVAAADREALTLAPTTGVRGRYT